MFYITRNCNIMHKKNNGTLSRALDSRYSDRLDSKETPLPDPLVIKILNTVF